MTRSDWEQAVRARTADPEAKRARHDAAFRRRYLAGLRRREAKALAWDATTLEGILQRVDTDETRTAELAEVARLRSIVRGRSVSPTALPACTAGVLVPIDVVTARRMGAYIDMRGKDATLWETRRQSYGNHCAGETEWKNGKPQHYTRATHYNYVRSLALITSPTTVDYICHTTRVRVALPAGYSWDVDPDGLRVVCDDSRRDDYHPDAADLLRRNATEYITGQLRANRERRQMFAAQRAAELAKIQGVYVCLADSLRAGNCPVGTRAFAARHGLDTRQHYEAPALLGLANGEANRVRLAITAARLRHERELKAGYCLLAEHRA
jgi:hypothetical protein